MLEIFVFRMLYLLDSVYIENHDNPRSVSRFGDDSNPRSRALSAKMLAMTQVALSGTLYVYQGEEIGMRNVPTTWGLDDYKDLAAKNYYWRYVWRCFRLVGSFG